MLNLYKVTKTLVNQIDVYEYSYFIVADSFASVDKNDSKAEKIDLIQSNINIINPTEI